MKRIRASGEWFDDPRGEVEDGYRLAWIADGMEIAGWGLRRPMNYRLALMKGDPEERAYLEIVSIHVPRSLAEWWGMVKTDKGGVQNDTG